MTGKKQSPVTVSQDINHTNKLVDDAGSRLVAAAQKLATATQDAPMIPAPTAYRLLAHVEVALEYLEAAARRTPAGLERCLTDPRITVTDTDPFTNTVRDPATSIHQTTAAITQLHHTLQDAMTHTTAARSAIDGQGWTITEEAQQDPLPLGKTTK